MDRRDFLGLGLVGGIAIFAPRFGRWFRPNRVYVPEWVDLPVQVNFSAGVGARPEGQYLPMPAPPMLVTVRVDRGILDVLRPDPRGYERYLRTAVERQLHLPTQDTSIPRVVGGLAQLVDSLDWRPFRNLRG